MDSVAICNMALGALGQHKLTSLEDESTAAELCSTFFDPAVDYCLEQKAWLFATEFVDLGAPIPTPDPDYPKKFLVPATIVAVHIVDDGSGEFSLTWEQRGNYVFTDSDVLFAKVTKRVESALWTPTFCWAVAYKIAETIAVPLTESLAAEARMEKRYDKEMAKATTLDGLRASPQRRQLITSAIMSNGSKLSAQR
jgi:hypothetical protein